MTSPPPQPPAAPSLRDLAQAAGVSISAVSTALRDGSRVAPATRDRILRLAHDLGYRPHALLTEAMSHLRLRTQPAHRASLAVLEYGGVSESSPPPLDACWRGMQARAALLGYSLDRIDGAGNPAPALFERMLQARGIRGILVQFRTDFPLVNAFRHLAERFPLVAVGDCHPDWIRAPLVSPDYFGGARMLCLEALRRGYQRPGLIFQTRVDRAHRFSLGFEATRARWAPSASNIPVLLIDGKETLQLSASDSDRIDTWLARHRVDCVITSDERIYPLLRQRSLPGGDQLGIMSWHVHQPDSPVSGWHQSYHLLGETAASLLISRLQQGSLPSQTPAASLTLIPGAWHEGETVRPPARAHTGRASFRRVHNAAAPCQPIDLKPWANRARTGESAWFGHLPLDHLQPGLHRFCGVPFSIPDETAETPFSFLAMRSDALPTVSGLPAPEQVSIPIESRLEALYILHAAAFVSESLPIAHYSAVFADAQRVSIPVIPLGRHGTPSRHANIQDWWNEFPQFSRTHARAIRLEGYESASERPAFLYVFEWVNPRPDVPIDRWDIRSLPRQSATLAVLAMSRLSPT